MAANEFCVGGDSNQHEAAILPHARGQMKSTEASLAPVLKRFRIDAEDTQ
jgi:hypothetical protein